MMMNDNLLVSFRTVVARILFRAVCDENEQGSKSMSALEEALDALKH